MTVRQRTFRGLRGYSGPERRDRNGRLVLSANQILLLHGLLDCPDGVAKSYREWIGVTWPYARRVRDRPSWEGLRCAMFGIHVGWVVQRRLRTRVECRLTDRGRAILARDVPARVWGFGDYRGLDRLCVAVRARQPVVVARSWYPLGLDAATHVLVDTRITFIQEANRAVSGLAIGVGSLFFSAARSLERCIGLLARPPVVDPSESGAGALEREVRTALAAAGALDRRIPWRLGWYPPLVDALLDILSTVRRVSGSGVSLES
jgi:hypothetical protein